MTRYQPRNLNAEQAPIFYRVIRLIANQHGKQLEEELLDIVGHERAAQTDAQVAAATHDNVFYMAGREGQLIISNTMSAQR